MLLTNVIYSWASLGLIMVQGDKNIAFEEIKRAMEQRKPYWFMVHRDVVFARKLFGKIKGADKIEIHRNDFFDKRCLDVYEYVIKTGTAIPERTGNWAQEFYSINDIFTFINTQFGDKNFVESILKQGK